PATPLAVAAVESAAELRAASLPFWPRLLQPLLLPAALYLRIVARRRNVKKWDKVTLVGQARLAVARGSDRLWTNVARRPVKLAVSRWRRSGKHRKRAAKQLKRLTRRVRQV